MDILESFVRNKSPEEVLELYLDFKDRVKHEEANILRTKFILAKVFGEDDFKNCPVFQTLVREERRFLNLNTLRAKYPNGLEFFVGDCEISRICGLINTYMEMSTNPDNQTFAVLRNVFFKESVIVTTSIFKKNLLSCINEMLIGVDKKYELSLVIKHLKVSSLIEGFEDLYLDFVEERDLLRHESNLENHYYEMKDRELVDMYEYLRNSLMVFMCIHWSKGNYFEAKSYIVKTLNIMSESDVMYNALRFIYKVLTEKEQQLPHST